MSSNFDGSFKPRTAFALLFSFFAILQFITLNRQYPFFGIASTSAALQYQSFEVQAAEAAVVRHAPVINGGRIEGTLQQLTGENVNLSSNSVLSSDFLVPGTPAVQLNGKPSFGGVVQGSGNPQPSNYTVTLSGNAMLSNLITRTDPIALDPVTAPPAPTGMRDVTISAAGGSVGDFASLRNLTLNGNVAPVAVPPGTYGRFIANGHGSFQFGVANSGFPTVYNLEDLFLSGGSELRLAGPVIINIAKKATIDGSSSVGNEAIPLWLELRAANISGGSEGVTLNGKSFLYGIVRTPSGVVTLNGGSVLNGFVYCDRLIVNGNSALKGMVIDRTPPEFAIDQPAEGAITDEPQITVKGTYKDESAVRIEVNGLDAVLENNTFRVDVPLALGPNKLTATAVDAFGNSNSAFRNVTRRDNAAPSVDAGIDQTITLPAIASLSGTVSDDGLPVGSALTVAWSKVSGPGTVTFGNPNSAVTTASFNKDGDYILRLTASDSKLTANDDVIVTVIPENHAPSVNAGLDQTITLPNTATLNGSVSDDGLPAGSKLTIAWSKVSGQGTVNFGSPNSAITTAAFSEAGFYILRLTATDSKLMSFDEVAVTVNPAEIVNQPPVVNAGQDINITFPAQTGSTGANLLLNPSNDLPLVNGEIPNWSEVVGAEWTRAPAGVNGFPPSFEGNSFFYGGAVPAAELRQDADVSAFASNIAEGNQAFEFKGYVRSFDQLNPDSCRIVVEYRDSANQSVLASYDSGTVVSVFNWQLLSNIKAAPEGTGWIRVRLIAKRNSGAANDAYFDALSLRAVSIAGTILNGSATDDGLPKDSVLSFSWSVVSGAGTVTFGSPNSARTSAVFGAPGVYVLRLNVSDTLLTGFDDVTVTVNSSPPTGF